MTLLSPGSAGSYWRLQSAQDIRGGGRPFAEDPRLRAGEVDHGGRQPGKLAAVHDGGRLRPDLLRDILEPWRVGAPWLVGAGRGKGACPLEHVTARPVQLGDTDTDRVGVRAGQPAVTASRIRQDERVRPRQQKVCERGGAP